MENRQRQGANVTDIAIMTMPVVDRAAWDSWMEEITDGSRAAEHRQWLQDNGIEVEHTFIQDTPDGTVMTLVWEGLTQAAAVQVAKQGLTDPTSDHERYVVEEVAPRAHGLDPAEAGPPPTPAHVASIEA